MDSGSCTPNVACAMLIKKTCGSPLAVSVEPGVFVGRPPTTVLNIPIHSKGIPDAVNHKTTQAFYSIFTGGH